MTRKSKREIADVIESLEETPPGDYPKLDNLSILLSYDWEIIDEENNLWERQENGQIYHYPQEMQDAFKNAFGE